MFQAVQAMAAGVAELGKAIAPLVQVFGPVASQVGSDAVVKGLRAMAGIDSKLSELAAQQRANAEADRATLERVQAVEVALHGLRDELGAHVVARQASAARLAAVEDAMRDLTASCAVKHANGGG